ncbi:MAG: type I polyketide synthase, partial [Pseudomonadota bacterium]
MTDLYRRLTELPRNRLALLAMDLQKKLDTIEATQSEPIAITGMACNFPGAPDIASFWEMLSEGRDGVSEMPKDRWDVAAHYSPDPEKPGCYYTKHAGFISGHDRFDAAFFGLTPLEATYMDPQHRLLLETAWHALEDAHLTRASLEGTRTGLFVGISTNDYMQHQVRKAPLTDIGPYLGIGNVASTSAGRLSYLLGLNGPSMAVDTACSSSLVALHLACNSLRMGESDAAMAAGVNMMLIPETFIYFSKLRALSPDGRCKTFDASADGYGRGEGCGVVVLKRLSDALAAGDKIIALVAGSDTNHSGRSNGLTVPSGTAQEQVVRRAIEAAGLTPPDIDFVEAHGTGTSLGDPIELHALGAVHRDRQDPLAIGSVKTNIGHLEAAAGIAGIIKSALALNHRALPGTLNFNHPNPHVDWKTTPIRPQTEMRELGEGPRAAGVSSFGFGGTNAHVVLKAAERETALAPKTKAKVPARPHHVLTMSARSASALKTLAEAAAERLTAPGADLASYAHGANRGRDLFEHRLSLRAEDAAEASAKLAAFSAAPSNPGAIHIGQTAPGTSAQGDLLYLFSGQGAQRPEMGRVLYETQPHFACQIDEIGGLMKGRLAKPLKELLFAKSDHLISRTENTQPVLFAYEVALARMLESWGIKPGAVMGHSVGEYAAAHLAGVFSLEDGVEMILARGRLMRELCAEGAMLALACDEATALELLETSGGLASLAAVNSPKDVTLGGDAATIERLAQNAEARGITARQLAVSHAFHSPLMDPALEAF